MLIARRNSMRCSVFPAKVTFRAIPARRTGQPWNPDGRGGELSELAKANRVSFRIVPRFYMPKGVMRVHAPDGYVIFVGQLD